MSMVAEGYYAAKSAYLLNSNHEVKTPIIDAVYDVLYQNKNPKTTFKKLTELLD
jgi:glycerol-3-phosphate dehydrogenase (NAD(P)+)